MTTPDHTNHLAKDKDEKTFDRAHYCSKLRFTIPYSEGNYKFEYDAKLLNGSFIVDLTQNHGIDRLKEVLNFHNIEYRHNLLDLFQTNSLLDRIYSMMSKESADKKKFFGLSHERKVEILKHHSSALEYFIINRSREDVQLILDEMQIDPDPTKYQWDYSSKTLSFGKKTSFYPTIKDVVFATIIKIILDESLVHGLLIEKWLNMNDNIILLLNQYLFDQFKENWYCDAKIKLSLLTLVLRHRKEDMFNLLDQIKDKLTDLTEKSAYPPGSPWDGWSHPSKKYIDDILQKLK